MNTVIIGGGAAGLMAAISAAQAGQKVTILEKTNVPGKKILSTGNGRCNLTNLNQIPEAYHSSDPDFVSHALSLFSAEDTMQFFSSLGLLFKIRDGYVYPRSLQAQTVRNVLLERAETLNVRILSEQKITKIRKNSCAGTGNESKHDFLILTETTSYAADKVILACGGCAAPQTGSDGSGYALAESFQHSIVPPVPALVPLLTDDAAQKKAAGVRAEGRVTIQVDGRTWSDTGEIQLTDYGISGIPVFQVSVFAAKALAEGKKVFAILDFLPEYSNTQAEKLMETLFHTEDRSCMMALCGAFPEKLAAAMLKKAGIPLHLPSSALNPAKQKRLMGFIKNWRMEINAAKSFDKAQVTGGGVAVSQVDPNTMESRLVPGLFFAGEILDVDGICGGYNLQWAWTSGWLAGKQEI